MSETVKEMNARHQKELEELQIRCPHKEKSDWRPDYYNFGSSSGLVRFCLACEARIVPTPREEKKLRKEGKTLSASELID